MIGSDRIGSWELELSQCGLLVEKSEERGNWVGCK